MSLNQILATIALITFIVYAVFNIVFLIDLRKTSFALRQFISRTEENLNPALAELKLALQDLRKLSADVSIVVERIRAATGAIIAVERSIRSVYGFYREGLGQAANENISALKAGVRAGVLNLIKNLKSKKEDHHE